jgi:hypothetical protein
MFSMTRTSAATFVAGLCGLALLVSGVADGQETGNALAHRQATGARDSTAKGGRTATPDPGRSSSNAAAPAGDAGGYVMVPVSALPQLMKATGAADEPEPGFWATICAAILAAVAWPLVVFCLVGRLMKAPQIELLLTRLYERTTKLTIVGLEINLSEGAKATLEDLQTLIAKVPATHQDWVDNSHLEDRFRYVTAGLRTYLCEKNADFPTPLPADEFSRFRFTLHVPDVLLTHSLRQLVNYIGFTRGGAGRLFSSRHGIIGLAWRLEASQFENKVFTPDELVRRWGMTRAEAADTSAKKGLLLAFVLKNDQGLPLGLLYADAETPALLDSGRIHPHSLDKAFGLIERKVKDLSAQHGMTASLQKLEDARVKVKQVDVYQAGVH